jgi:hypothetical protein
MLRDDPLNSLQELISIRFAGPEVREELLDVAADLVGLLDFSRRDGAEHAVCDSEVRP